MLSFPESSLIMIEQTNTSDLKLHKEIRKPHQTGDVSVELLAKSSPGPRFINNLWLKFISVLPMMLAIFLLASSTSLLSMLHEHYSLELPAKFGQWILFYSLILTAPAAAYLGQVVPTGRMLLVGALVSTVGHTSLLLSTPVSQILLLAITTGIGTAIVFQTAYASLSGSFCRQSVTLRLLLLLILGIVMAGAKPLLNLMGLMYTGIAVVGISIMVICITLADVWMKDHQVDKTDVLILSKEFPTSADDQLNQSARLIFLIICCEIGLDLSWLSYHHPDVSLKVASLQCAFSMISLGVSFITLRQTKQRTKRDSHCLTLGLIGTAGMTVVIFPALVNVFHMTFSLVYIAQIMNFTDVLAPSLLLTRPLSSSAKLQISQEVELNERVVHPSFKAVLFLLLAAVLFIFFNPLTYICYWALISVQMETEYDVIFLGFLSGVAIGLSCLQSRSRTKTESYITV